MLDSPCHGNLLERELPQSELDLANETNGVPLEGSWLNVQHVHEDAPVVAVQPFSLREHVLRPHTTQQGITMRNAPQCFTLSSYTTTWSYGIPLH